MRQVARFLLLSAALALSACGKDETDFNDLKGKVGVVAGNFNMRLAELYRGKIDALQAKIDGVAPGLSSQLTQRFAGSEESTDGKTKLSDLLKVKIPGTESEVINQQIFRELQRLSGDGGAYFDVVDTEKYLQGPSAYVPPTSSDPKYDPEMGNQYYLDMIRWYDAVKDVDALLPGAQPVVVAVLDTGVLATHEDLKDQMWKGPNAEVGYDATTGQTLAQSEAADGNGHGTHVAGIIGAAGGNAKGIHGVGYVPGRGGVQGQSLNEIMAVKVLNDNGAGTSTSITDGLKWAVDSFWAQKNSVAGRSKQKMIVNMSLGGAFEAETYPYKKDEGGNFVFEDDLFNYATAKNDVLIVVAAGNESCGISGPCELYGESYKQTYYFPCSYKNVLCVAATTFEDKLAGFSNRKGSVGLAAPGYQIESTIPTGTSYGYYSGTSQATPVTSGAASIVWALYPDFDANDIKAILQKTASKVTDITAEIASADGRLDLKAALTYAAALKKAGAKPADQEPAAGVVLSDKQAPKQNPPTGTLDPNAPSQNAVGDAGPEDKGDGSANGCGVVGSGDRGQTMALWTLLLPLGFLVFTSRRASRSRRNGARNP